MRNWNLRKIWLDVDGVVCDSNDAWLRWASEVYGIPLDTRNLTAWTYMKDTFGEEAMEWWSIKGSYKYFVKPFPDTLDFINKIITMGYRNVNFITSTYKGMEDEKDACLLEWFGEENVGQIVHAWNKWEILDRHDILIDDNKDTDWRHVIDNNAYAVQLNYQNKHPYAQFDPEIGSHSRLYYATTYDRVLDCLFDIERNF